MSARTEPVTIAHMPIGEADWHGGQTMLGNAMRTLREVAGARVRIVTVGGNALYPWSDGAIVLNPPRPWGPRRALNGLAIRLTRRNIVFEGSLRAAGVDILIGETLPWRLGRI